MYEISEESLMSFCLQIAPEHTRYPIMNGEIDHISIAQGFIAKHMLKLSEYDPDIIQKSDEYAIHSVSDLGFRVGKISADGKTVRIYTFGIKEATKATALQILGIALTLFYAPLTPALGVQTLSLMKSLWEKLTVLERPQNADAIDILESIGRLRAIHLAEGDESLPSTAEILEDRDIDSAVGQAALKFLESKKIIEAVKWGNQSSDFTHPDTRWRICL